MATGSEVSLCISAYEQLTSRAQGRVVSMPSWYLFEKQSEEYKRSVLPPNVKARVSVEAAATLGWNRYVGPNGTIIGMHRFGASVPEKTCSRNSVLSTDAVVEEPGTRLQNPDSGL